jgi:hypothetical protein
VIEPRLVNNAVCRHLYECRLQGCFSASCFCMLV